MGVIRSMNLSADELNEWASAYIEAQESTETIDENHPMFWPIMKFFDLSLDHPEMCWTAILVILSREPSDKVLGILAAGPLEDLIEDHGPEYIEKIEAEAKANPAFKHLLGGVWESSTQEVWDRVQRIRDKPW